MKIVHVTPHLGGGIGAAYAGTTRPDGHFAAGHTILLLEKPVKPVFVERVRAGGVEILVEPSRREIERLFRDADIVQCNWWQHPVIAKFLYEFPEIPVRAVGWIHNSGCTYPYLRGDFLRRFAKVLFTTPFTYEHAEIAAWSEAERKKRTAVVYGMSDVSRFLSVEPESHEGFRIGYLGTLDFSKLHPRFVDFCAAAAAVAPDIRFTMIGDPGDRDAIQQRAKSYGIDDRFEFRGFREDIAKEFSRIDCLGYLLNPDHFGATENVMLEAMGAGIPVVAMNQCTEKYIVRNEKTGFLIGDEHEYRAAIQRLYSDTDLRRRMGIAARATVVEHYATDENNATLGRAYEQVMRRSKETIGFRDLLGKEPADWFLYFVEKERPFFYNDRIEELGDVFRSETKGSLRQFASAFPRDTRLHTWLERLA